MRLRPRIALILDLRSLIGWLILGLVILLAFRGAAHAQAGTNTSRPSILPPFHFEGLSGSAVTQGSLKKGLSTVVVFFDPDCDHCQRQAQWIKAAEGRFAKTQFLWVSTAERAAIAAFGPKYLAGAKGHHLFAQDTKYQFDAWFGYSISPTILAYDAAGKLKHTWSNEVAAEEIAAVLR